MKFSNICTKKTYKSNGEEKTIWLNAGTLRENGDGKKFIELNHQPDTTFYVFEQKKKEAEQDEDDRGEEVKVGNIPF